MEDKTTKTEEGRQKRWATKGRTGCKTCRARRIKCDEGRPSCRKCIASKRECAGYEALGMPSHLRPIVAIAPRLASQPLLKIAPQPALAPRIHSTADVRDIIALLRSESPIPFTEDDYSLDMQLGLAQRSSFFHELPKRAGYDSTLDSAIKSLAAALRWRVTNTAARPVDNTPAFVHYGDALKSLRTSLYDEKKSKTAETLCATQLLCTFEAVVKATEGLSLHHVNGASQLIRHRGAKMFKSDFDKALLASQLPGMIVNDYYRGEHSFLEAPDWHDTIRSVIDRSDGKYSDKSEVFISLFTIGTAHAGLISDCVDYFNAPVPSRRQDLLKRLAKQRANLNAWYNKWSGDLISLTHKDGTPRTRIYTGEELKPGCLMDHICVFDGYLFAINRAYVALGGDDADEVEQESVRAAVEMIGVEELLDRALDMDGDTKPLVAKAHGIIGSPAQTITVIGCLGVAYELLKTAKDWEPYVQPLPEGIKRQVVPTDLFFKWMAITNFPMHRLRSSPGADTLPKYADTLKPQRGGT